ncbi:MAG: Holliday junction branch migration DNA helicase RuvB [Chloroflexi bacterium]|nr:Holliday junction branch migration DNA helicase RuvB [Chloroflexota bacterium]
MPRERILKPQEPDEPSSAAPPPLPEPDGGEADLANRLRPRSLATYIGQSTLVEGLNIAITAATRRGEPLDHVLFHGPPGLGKTTLAHIISGEMHTAIHHTSGPALERPVDLVGILSRLEEGEVLFIDEIHRLPHAVEEYLYSAMEDFRIDVMTGKGPSARSIPYPLQKFTLVGATTRSGLLSAPLRDRFGLIYHLDYYSVQELTEVVLRSASILGVQVQPGAAVEIARRARGTPRIANRLLRRVRDFAEVRAAGTVTERVAHNALDREGVDPQGLDSLDRLYLNTILDHYKGGPVGLEALAATLNEDQSILVDVVEPYLLKMGFVLRSPTGRKVSDSARAHLGRPARGEQSRLL